MLVADTQHSSRPALPIPVPTWTNPRPLQAQFGETDHGGTDDSHLDSPKLVSINGGRAVVYDSGNQRLVKLRVH